MLPPEERGATDEGRLDERELDTLACWLGRDEELRLTDGCRLEDDELRLTAGGRDVAVELRLTEGGREFADELRVTDEGREVDVVLRLATVSRVLLFGRGATRVVAELLGWSEEVILAD